MVLRHGRHAAHRQDWPLCERTQEGIRSRAYLPGPRHPEREPYVAEFTRMYWHDLDNAEPGM
ncbi:SRPBCC family protein [Sinosporangium siamense]|uniref:SRPBCC family protein n=1 Tax=Sinosporangium siamense TaxID=1367973 RepID=UPI00194E2611